MKKVVKFFAKWGTAFYLVQAGLGIGVGIAFGLYLAMHYTPEEVERIMSCVAH